MSALCPVCKIDAPLYFSPRDYNRKISPKHFDYYRCERCRLIFLQPIPDDLGVYYPQQYYTIPPTLQQLAAGAERERFKLQIVQKFVTKGRLLEIGPSHGSFTFLAKNAGFDVEVLERDAACCTFLREVVGVRALNNCDTTDALKDAGPYDVIALWHVIEHLSDPWSTLKAMAERLRPGGILVLATPNPDAFQFRILGRFWTHVDAPRHLSLIPLSLMQKEAGSLGLKMVFSTTTDKGGLMLNPIGWKDSFGNLGKRGFFRSRFRDVARLISLITSPIEHINGLGSAYTAVFQKEKAL